MRADPSPIQDQPVQALQHGRDQFEAVFEESFDAMVLVNNDRVIIHANEHATKVFGLSQPELLGRSLDEFLVTHSILRRYGRNSKRLGLTRESSR